MAGHSVVTTESQAAGVRLSRVRQVFDTDDGPVVALDGIDLHIGGGEFVAMLGPSGCGKSTLLRLIAGLDLAHGGEVSVNGGKEGRCASPAQREGIAYVFQDAHLLPWRSVLRNVELPLELMGENGTERRAAARAALEQVGLADAMNRYPAQLSGGMKMRVSLARAMVTRPRLLLLDEPFAALDEITRHRLDEQLRSLWEQRRMTVLFVTHSIHEATFLAERVVVMSSRPGRIMLDHRLELPARRDSHLRTDGAFTAQMRVLQEALERGFA
ncbi:MAG: ABC transporter ATP-binding protein [Phycisphaeraceae bacterium]